VGTKIWRRNAESFPHTPHTSLSGGGRSLRLDPSSQAFSASPFVFTLLYTVYRFCASPSAQIRYVDSILTFNRPGIGITLTYMAVEAVIFFFLTMLYEVLLIVFIMVLH